MELAHFLWEATPEGTTSDEVGWQAALDNTHLELRDEFDLAWRGLNDAERRTLVAIATGPGVLTRKETLDGLQLPRSTAQDARDRLLGDGFIQGRGGQLEIVDPLLALWVARGRQGFNEPNGGSEEV